VRGACAAAATKKYVIAAKGPFRGVARQVIDASPGRLVNLW